MKLTQTHFEVCGGEVWGFSEMHLPTLVVTVRRGFPSDDALLGISFRTMATVLSAALESFPYNSKINNDLCQDSFDNAQPSVPRPGDCEEQTD